MYGQKKEQYAQAQKKLIGNFINLEYSRNIAIVENALKKFKEYQNKEARPNRRKFEERKKLKGFYFLTL